MGARTVNPREEQAKGYGSMSPGEQDEFNNQDDFVKSRKELLSAFPDMFAKGRPVGWNADGTTSMGAIPRSNGGEAAPASSGLAGSRGEAAEGAPAMGSAGTSSPDDTWKSALSRTLVGMAAAGQKPAGRMFTPEDAVSATYRQALGRSPTRRELAPTADPSMSFGLPALQELIRQIVAMGGER